MEQKEVRKKGREGGSEGEREGYQIPTTFNAVMYLHSTPTVLVPEGRILTIKFQEILFIIAKYCGAIKQVFLAGHNHTPSAQEGYLSILSVLQMVNACVFQRRYDPTDGVACFPAQLHLETRELSQHLQVQLAAVQICHLQQMSGHVRTQDL